MSQEDIYEAERLEKEQLEQYERMMTHPEANQMGLMKKVDIEIKNSHALSYLNHELEALKVQVKGLGVIAKELLTAVDLKHLD